MDASDLDSLIDSLERLIAETTTFGSVDFFKAPSQFFSSQRHDWRPVWALCSQIQAALKEVRYPSKAARDEAWIKFNDLRNHASRLSATERDEFRSASEAWRDHFIEEASHYRFSRLGELICFFDPMTVEDIKKMGQALNAIRQELIATHPNMLREHRDECHAKINEIRASHDYFWQAYKESIEQRHKENERKHAEFEARRSARIENTRDNLEKNRDRESKQEDALERVDDHISDLDEKIATARSDEWRERFEAWREKAYEKRRSIIESLERTRKWIEQDEERLDDLQRER